MRERNTHHKGGQNLYEALGVGKAATSASLRMRQVFHKRHTLIAVVRTTATRDVHFSTVIATLLGLGYG